MVMSHQLDRSDVIDFLEEAVTLRTPLSVTLRHGKHFVDHVHDVVSGPDEDWAVFAAHGRVPVTGIADCARAEPFAPTYAGKM
jgi:hypothetical protein